jgi:putative ABC transport system permease protein
VARFDQRDLTKLKRIPEASLVAPVVSRALNVTGEGKTESSDLYSTTGDLFTLRNLKAEYGRVFDNKDVEKSAKIAVIGPKLAEKLFGSSQLALGKTIRMQSQRYLVEGILESKGGGGFGGPDFDSFVYVPYTAAYSINTDKKFFQFYIGARTEGDIPRLKQEVEKVLLSRYKSDDFSIIEQKEILNAVTTIFNVLNIVLIAIGSISLVVGGIGIMNIMYASVTERIKEIGIRRAIGATRRDVLLQFVSEAVILSLMGGFLGLSLSFLIVLAIKPFFPAEINSISVIVALGVSSAIGIFFGAFPASRASKFSPIEAIRYE